MDEMPTNCVESEPRVREREGKTLDFSRKPSEFVSPSALAEAIRRGWQVDPERKRQWFEAMDREMKNVQSVQDPKDRAQIVIGCNRVLQSEQSAAVRDIHHVERLEQENGIMKLKMQRAEEGIPNDSMAIVLPPEMPMPMPLWMREAKGVG